MKLDAMMRVTKSLIFSLQSAVLVALFLQILLVHLLSCSPFISLSLQVQLQKEILEKNKAWTVIVAQTLYSAHTVHQASSCYTD